MAKRLGLSLVLAILTGICEAQAEGPNLWATKIAYDKKVPEPAVPIYINEKFQSQGNLLVLHYQVPTQKGWSWPAVFALYSSGYFRLAPATNPPTNFGTSAILGPAYWSNGNYYHNPTLSEIRLSGDMKHGLS